MTKELAKDTFGWGFMLWLIGYVLGIILFPFVSPLVIGWIIMPIGIIITLWVLLNRIHLKSLTQFILLAFIWLIIALVLDYLFIIKLIKPTDGYYKLDVYFYYLLIFLLPIIVGYRKFSKK